MISVVSADPKRVAAAMNWPFGRSAKGKQVKIPARTTRHSGDTNEPEDHDLYFDCSYLLQLTHRGRWNAFSARRRLEWGIAAYFRVVRIIGILP